MAPFHSDNAPGYVFIYKLGYVYTGRVRNQCRRSSPPSTLVQRNPVANGLRHASAEHHGTPHAGWAGGLDVEVARRNHSADHTFGGTVFSGKRTRQYLKASAFFTGATGLPCLSERHRLIGTFHAGYAPEGSVDRFSAFRLGGGPFPSETDDLYRYWYPGALFNQFPVSDFVVGSLEYRYEILFFLYLHLRYTTAEMNRPFFQAG